MRVANNIYELIGETPIVKLNKVVDEESAEIYLKLEWFNPGKSIKDRIALGMIESAENEGLLKPRGTIVEPTSGNTGIGLAMVGAAKGYKVILTMPETMSIERRKLLKAYGAEIIITPGADGMSGAIKKAQELIEENPDYYMPQQFNNPANPEIHRKTTAQEILKQMGNELDVFIAGVGTGGTLTGIGEILKENIQTIKVVAVEPATSAVLSGEDRGPHKIQGIGAGFVPDVLNTEIYDEVEKVSDEEAFAAARRVVKEEGIFVGISCGAAIVAAIRQAKKLGKGKKVLAISPDTGLKYLSSGLVED